MPFVNKYQGPRRRGGWGGYSPPPTFFVNHIRFSNLTILNAHKERPDRLCLLDVIVTKIGIEISVALMNRTVINSLHIYALFVKKIVKIVLLVTGIITLVLVFVKRLLR